MSQVENQRQLIYTRQLSIYHWTSALETSTQSSCTLKIVWFCRNKTRLVLQIDSDLAYKHYPEHLHSQTVITSLLLQTEQSKNKDQKFTKRHNSFLKITTIKYGSQFCTVQRNKRISKHMTLPCVQRWQNLSCKYFPNYREVFQKKSLSINTLCKGNKNSKTAYLIQCLQAKKDRKVFQNCMAT